MRLPFVCKGEWRPGGATIKLADLIDNSIGIAEHDKGIRACLPTGGRCTATSAEAWE
jgi:hypothetical protein